jgi:hypothetical protein
VIEMMKHNDLNENLTDIELISENPFVLKQEKEDLFYEEFFSVGGGSDVGYWSL